MFKRELFRMMLILSDRQSLLAGFKWVEVPRLVSNLFQDETNAISDISPVSAIFGVTVSEEVNQISSCIIDVSCIVEQIIE